MVIFGLPHSLPASSLVKVSHSLEILCFCLLSASSYGFSAGEFRFLLQEPQTINDFLPEPLPLKAHLKRLLVPIRLVLHKPTRCDIELDRRHTWELGIPNAEVPDCGSSHGPTPHLGPLSFLPPSVIKPLSLSSSFPRLGPPRISPPLFPSCDTIFFENHFTS